MKISEGDRQLVVLALAVLASTRPALREELGRIAAKIDDDIDYSGFGKRSRNFETAWMVAQECKDARAVATMREQLVQLDALLEERDRLKSLFALVDDSVRVRNAKIVLELEQVAKKYTADKWGMAPQCPLCNRHRSHHMDTCPFDLLLPTREEAMEAYRLLWEAYSKPGITDAMKLQLESQMDDLQPRIARPDSEYGKEFFDSLPGYRNEMVRRRIAAGAP